MNDESTPLNELENLSHFLHGAHLASDHENSSATFHQAKHMLDEFITKIKLNYNKGKSNWMPLSNPPPEDVKKKTCCGTEWSYLKPVVPTPVCPKCGKRFNE